MFKPLKIALASYDRKELRVQKHYLEEEGAPISCTCFLSGERLFRCLQQDHSFDVAILCNEMEDMTGLEFMEHIRALEQRPVLLLFNEARRNNESALCMETEEGIFCVEQADLKSLLRELYRMPGQQGQKLERQRLGPFHCAAHAGRAGGEHHLRAIGAHQLDALDAGRFRHHDDGAVAARRAQHAQADARVAAGGLDDQRARADAARLLRRAQHLQGGTILDAAAGIEIFQLGQQLPLQS